MSKLELPHELLLRKYGLDINKLSSHTRQLKSDLDKTMMMIVNKSRNGRINMTPATKSKIDTYDRYICDGIFEYLENADVINENQADSMESQMDSQRQSQMNKINTENNTPNQQNPQNNTGSGGDAKIGFWDWS
jgi:dsDNA-binding SOS-regulon protein